MGMSKFYVKMSHQKLTACIRSMANERGTGKTFCPSEVARQEGGESWRDLMDDVREAAARMVSEGTLQVLQKGEVVDPATAQGPVRYRKAR